VKTGFIKRMRYGGDGDGDGDGDFGEEDARPDNHKDRLWRTTTLTSRHFRGGSTSSRRADYGF
jgi:hypothetical protein